MPLKPILFFLFVGSLATFVVVRQIQLGDGGIIRIGQMAPEFTLKGPDGAKVQLTDYRGKLVFLNFWASWCAPCAKEMPDLEVLNTTFKNRKFQMISISVDASLEEAVKFYNQRHLTLPWYHDPGRTVADRYKVNVYPETFLIDGNGHVIKHWPGAVNTQIMDLIEGYIRDQEGSQASAR